LSYLQRFPFDKIKIDRSFVSQMEKNADSMSIIRAVIALGKSLRIKITAEGVETPTQLELLQQENCDQVQGYLLASRWPRKISANSSPPPSATTSPSGSQRWAEFSNIDRPRLRALLEIGSGR